MEGFRLVVPVSVRFRDCDSLGHVNNAVYFTYLEEARFRWFRDVFGDGGFAKHSIILADVKCSFRAPATHGEILEVGIRVERIGRSSFAHRYRIEATAHPRRLIAEAESVGVGFDYDTQKSRPLSDDFRKAVEAHQGPVPAPPG
jgi:acyl-CoA thioester hydrolase